MCDNQCSKESFKFYQLAAIVTGEGGAAHTINLCMQCYHVLQLKRGERDDRSKGFWRESVCGLWHGAICAKNVGTFHHQKRRGSVLIGAEKERQEGKEGVCQAHQGPAIRRFFQFVVHSTQESQVTGKAIWQNSEKTTSSVFGQVVR